MAIENLNHYNVKGKSVCVEDFCGYTKVGHFFTQFWAFYFPESKVILFGGDLWEVPPIFSDTEPTEQDIQIIADFYA